MTTTCTPATKAGHEAYHPPMPGEVSIPPHETGVTTYAVHAPGKVLFACHLPGHFAYGMKGYVIVEDANHATGVSSTALYAVC